MTNTDGNRKVHYAQHQAPSQKVRPQAGSHIITIDFCYFILQSLAVKTLFSISALSLSSQQFILQTQSAVYHK